MLRVPGLSGMPGAAVSIIHLAELGWAIVSFAGSRAGITFVRCNLRFLCVAGSCLSGSVAYCTLRTSLLSLAQCHSV